MIRLLAFLPVAVLAACSSADQAGSNVCNGEVTCGTFDIARSKESSPLFFPPDTASAVFYRLCVAEGSVILQTIENDGNATSLAGEIRADNCTDVAFAGKTYIIGNTAPGRSHGFYYRVP